MVETDQSSDACDAREDALRRCVLPHLRIPHQLRILRSRVFVRSRRADGRAFVLASLCPRSRRREIVTRHVSNCASAGAVQFTRALESPRHASPFGSQRPFVQIQAVPSAPGASSGQIWPSTSQSHTLQDFAVVGGAGASVIASDTKHASTTILNLGVQLPARRAQTREAKH